MREREEGEGGWVGGKCERERDLLSYFLEVRRGLC